MSVKKAKTFGMIKVWQQRIATYISMINFIMIFYLYIIESPMGLEWYHWLILISVSVGLIIYIDVKIILPESQDYMFYKTPFMVKMREDVEEIKKAVLEEKHE